MKNRKPGSAAETILLSAADAIGMTGQGKCTLDDYLDRHAPRDFRKSVEHLLLAFFRNRAFLESELRRIAAKIPREPVRNLLLAAFAQTRFQSAIAPESAASVAVDAAKKYHAEKFVNACLRRYIADETPLPGEAEKILPPAVFKRWKKRFTAEELQFFARLFTSDAPFTFRLEKNSAEADFPCTFFCKMGNGMFYQALPADVLSSEALKAGSIYIQDPATACAVSLPDYSRVHTVLDLCAAPGGKSIMMWEQLTQNAELTAFDKSFQRQKLTRENFRKRNMPCKVRTGSHLELDGSFDLVLADVPCSNTGVFRHRPDALWRFCEKDLTETLKLQKQLLQTAADRTAPGGQLVYSTCSIEPEENDGMTDHFVNSNPDFELISRQTILPSLQNDGAFCALFRRRF